MGANTDLAVSRFLASARALFAAEKNAQQRRQKLGPLLRELLVGPVVRAQSKKWPACVQRDRAEPDYADVRQTRNFRVGPGDVDLVQPRQIHAEGSGEERTVAIIVQSEKAGGFLQGRYNPANTRYWQEYGPHQIPYDLE